MHDPWEEALALDALSRMLAHQDQRLRSEAMSIVCDHLPSVCGLVTADEVQQAVYPNDATPSTKERVRRSLRLVGTCREKMEPIGFSVTERSLRAVARLCDLDRIDRQILGFFVRRHLGSPLGILADHSSYGSRHSIYDRQSVIWICGMIGIGRYRMQRAFGPLGRLVSLGLIDLRSEPGRVVVLRSVIDCVGNGLTKSEKVRHFLLGDEVCPVRGWDDFAHLGGEVETVGRILSGALEQRQPGAHVLLYGPPGTGKTELAKVLAARIGAALFAVGEADRQGGEPSRGDRLGTWRLQQNLIPNDSRRLLLFDEMEDLFFGGGDPFSRLLAASGSKVFMHRLMETNPIPTIWTANSISAIEPAFLRRFTYALEVPIPGERVRGRMWSRELHAAGIEADDATAAGLAAEFPAAPGLLTGAVKAAALAGGGTEVVRLAVRGIAKAMKGGRAPAPFRQIEERYDPALVNASADLAALAERLARPGATRTFSLCLHGGPGTGKSEYVRWLARRLDLPLLAKRASDIISMWVGETERNIARAFEEARREQAFLQFDEADSFLSSRQGALHSWEISQVNEMLTWMESHELPFVCTTNLMQALDEASLRRFTFKVRFDPLTRQQRTLAFKKFFEFEPPRGLDSLDLLTPGDFAVVNRRATISGTLGDPRALLDMLAEEQTAKPQASRPIGFAAGP